MSGKTCSSCRFYSKFAGECRFTVPVAAAPDHKPVWPKVCQLDWCGKFEPGESGAPAAPAPASTPAGTESYRGADCLNMVGAVIDYFGQSFVVTSRGYSQLLGNPSSPPSGHATPSAITFLRWATREECERHGVPYVDRAALSPTQEPKQEVPMFVGRLTSVPAWAAKAAERFFSSILPDSVNKRLALAMIFEAIREECAKELDRQADSIEATRAKLKLSDQLEARVLLQQAHSLRVAARYFRDNAPKIQGLTS